MDGIKSQDIVVLLKLVSLQEQEERNGLEDIKSDLQGEAPYSVRGLEALLGISKSEINAAIRRSLSTGLAIKDPRSGRPKPNRRNLHGFIVHGLKYVFPAKPGAITRGIATAFAAPMLARLLLSAGDQIHVWPSADGQDQGQSVQPLFRSVPQAVQNDSRLYAYLALVDAVRLGNPREAGLAADLLAERLLRK